MPLTISSSDTGPILRMSIFVITSSGRTVTHRHIGITAYVAFRLTLLQLSDSVQLILAAFY